MIILNRSVFLLIALCLWQHAGYVLGQELPEKNIPEVTVVQNNNEFFSDDQPATDINVESLHTIKGMGIGSVLQQKTSANIKSYGSAGSLTTLSVHGTGSTHTQVSWNGFPVNSPSTGQVDLSLIPVGVVQSVELINGASGALFGSGTFGGSVHLKNLPDWENRIAVDYSMGVGSYGNYSHSLILKTGTSNFQYQLAAITSGAENNFTYHDYYKYESPEIENSHNKFRAFGIMQNIDANFGNGHYLNAGLWYQQKKLEIPSIMGSYNKSNAEQKDSLFRIYISYSKVSPKSVLHIKTAYFSDFLHYTDKADATDSSYTINSGIATSSFRNEADFRYYLSSNLVLGGGFVYTLLNGNSNNYNGKISENEYAVYTGLKLLFPRFIINTGLRKEFYKDVDPQLQYMIGARFKITETLVVRADVSNKFRKPTFNEKYWRNGGNPLLRPEKGWGGELSAEWSLNQQNNQRMDVHLRVSGFYQQIDNWIQWITLPLTPVEYKKVRSSGIESWLDAGYKGDVFSITGTINYNYNRSVITETYDNDLLYEGNQLMYTPVNTIKISMETCIEKFSFSLDHSYTGYREAVETADPGLRLPAYNIFNASAGYFIELRSFSASVYVFVENIFDKQYEVIRSYATPGRVFQLAVSVGLAK